MIPLIRKDPMGNKERWYVDSGIGKGFVPTAILQPLDFKPPAAPTRKCHICWM